MVKVKDRLMHVHFADNGDASFAHLPAGWGNVDLPYE
jgi:sugar phosphate isomerase/epimerase